MPSCYIEKCKSKWGSNENKVTFHRFPANMKKKWLTALGKDPNLDICHTSVVCSLHFQENDFLSYGVQRRLKIGTVPSQKLSKTINCETKIKIENESLPYLIVEKDEPEFEYKPESEVCTPDVSFAMSPARSDSSEMSNSSVSINLSPVRSDISSAPSPTELRRRKYIVKHMHNYSRPPGYMEEKIAMERNHIMYYKAKCKNLQRINRRLKLKVASLNLFIKDLKKKSSP